MKKTLLSAALIAGFGVAAFAPQAANAADGTITFSGKVLSSTCAVQNSGAVAVTLPPVQMSLLATPGQVAGLTPFALTLTGCPITPAGVKVGVAFDTTNVDATSGAVKNSTSAGYSTAQVQITTAAGVAIDLNAAPTAPATVISGTGTATLSYQAQYYAKTAATTAGLVSAVETFTLTYN